MIWDDMTSDEFSKQLAFEISFYDVQIPPGSRILAPIKLKNFSDRDFLLSYGLRTMSDQRGELPELTDNLAKTHLVGVVHQKEQLYIHGGW